MSKEVLLVVESVSNEKGVPASVIFEALELALRAVGVRPGDVVCVHSAFDQFLGFQGNVGDALKVPGLIASCWIQRDGLARKPSGLISTPGRLTTSGPSTPSTRPMSW